MTYRLHYAPDNASLIIRLALEELGAPYETQLVNRVEDAQQSAAYLRLNPNGLIPTLETPQATLFETGAILLWLADTHGALAPGPDTAARGDFLKWLFFLSNTVHAEMRMLFYPQKYIGDDAAHQTALRAGLQKSLAAHLQKLERLASAGHAWFAAPAPSMLDLYVATLLRWLALYPKEGARWFSLSDTPHLYRLASQVECRASVQAAIKAEGLGPTPFTQPAYATPPEGSAT
jgi:glutathione S-transferase